MDATQAQARAQREPSSSSSGELKRKRSPSNDAHAQPTPPQAKAAKTNQHLQINYLARQYGEDLPLVSTDDTLPSILALLGEYQGVLERHESMAGNLGARPLGPILIKRFERLFDGPPRVLKSHGKDGTTVTWLDVVEFARGKPEQFGLGQMSEGVRVCQFYTKQCRVQISEEDFVLINSGIPQKMIPPQPIVEDEEKELGTLEILEKNLGMVCQLADQVAARTRQLNHRLKGRKQAILDRRATDTGPVFRASSPSNVALMNGVTQTTASTALASLSQAAQPTAGFVAVNSRPAADLNGGGGDPNNLNSKGASPATRHELLSKFFTVSDRRAQGNPANGDAARSSASTPVGGVTSPAPPHSSRPPIRQTTSNSASYPDASDYTLAHHAPLASPPTPNSTVPIPNTPLSLLPPSSSAAAAGRHAPAADKDDGGPFKAEMVARVEGLAKGERVIPPCDRCRRLHMDCLKNLTACVGCTRKHAKCCWRDVRPGELRAAASAPPPQHDPADVELLAAQFGLPPPPDAEQRALAPLQLQQQQQQADQHAAHPMPTLAGHAGAGSSPAAAAAAAPEARMLAGADGADEARMAPVPFRAAEHVPDARDGGGGGGGGGAAAAAAAAAGEAGLARVAEAAGRLEGQGQAMVA